MDRASLQTRRKKTKPVEIDGDTFHIVKLSQAAAETLQRSYSAKDTAATGIAYVCQQCLATDESGERMFKDGPDELKEVQKLDFPFTKAIAEAAIEFSGLQKPDDEKEAPNAPKA